MPILNLNHASLNVFDQGRGPVILMVHGFPLTHAMWEFQIEALKENYRVLAPDLRGFGKSSHTRGTMDMRKFADDLAEVLDALEISEPVTFCGLSMGGYIAWQFVKHHANRLDKLILCDTKASADDEDAEKNRHKLADSVLEYGADVVAQAMPKKLFAKSTLQNQSDIVSQCKEMMLEAHPEGIAAALRGMAERPDMREFLPNISLPTLVIVGEEDQITTTHEMRAMAEMIPQATFLEVPNAGHMAPMENPEPVNQAIKKFLANH